MYNHCYYNIKFSTPHSINNNNNNIYLKSSIQTSSIDYTPHFHSYSHFSLSLPTLSPLLLPTISSYSLFLPHLPTPPFYSLFRLPFLIPASHSLFSLPTPYSLLPTPSFYTLFPNLTPPLFFLLTFTYFLHSHALFYIFSVRAILRNVISFCY